MLTLKNLENYQSDARFPLHVLQIKEKTIGFLGDAAVPALPFAAQTYADTVVNSAEEAVPLLSSSKNVESLAFSWCARVTFSVARSSKRHGLLLRNVATNVTASHFVDDNEENVTKTLKNALSALEANSELWKTAATKAPPQVSPLSCNNLHVYFTSEPEVAVPLSTSLSDLPHPSTRNVTTRVVLGNSAREITAALHEIFTSLLTQDASIFVGTEVCWPAELLFPVNVHTTNDDRRRREHAALLLPHCGRLHRENALRQWKTYDDILQFHKHQQQQQPTLDDTKSLCRIGSAWERHLVTNPHTELPATAAPSLHGAETLLTSGCYDYYHYRVDGFSDDGWGCAYRSLQTLLSWFQHAGWMTAPMPSLQRIQEILYAVDPDKADKAKFVGSHDWIGSFEVMLVLQHYMPGLDCTIRRLESGKDLETDTSVQLLLSEHFRHPHAAPVMIGGSSYAHTILGIHVNVNTMEARYLVLDPHYSANPTQLKTAIKKGFVGWKEASKFFEAGSWYNLCIPRTDLYDPR